MKKRLETVEKGTANKGRTIAQKHHHRRCRRCLTTAAATGPATAPLLLRPPRQSIHRSPQDHGPHTQQPQVQLHCPVPMCPGPAAEESPRKKKNIAAATSRGAAHRISRNQSMNPGRCRCTAAHLAHRSHLAPQPGPKSSAPELHRCRDRGITPNRVALAEIK